MGILRNLFRGKSGSNAVAVESPVPGQSRTQIRMQVSPALDGQQGLVKLSGTTTFARDAITRLAQRHAIDKGGHLEMQGSLQREPDNPADPKAVAVHVEGEKVGYLSGLCCAGSPSLFARSTVGSCTGLHRAAPEGLACRSSGLARGRRAKMAVDGGETTSAVVRSKGRGASGRCRQFGRRCVGRRRAARERV